MGQRLSEYVPYYAWLYIIIVQVRPLSQMTASKIGSGCEDHRNLQHLNVVKIVKFTYIPLLENYDVPLNSMAVFPMHLRNLSQTNASNYGSGCKVHHDFQSANVVTVARHKFDSILDHRKTNAMLIELSRAGRYMNCSQSWVQLFMAFDAFVFHKSGRHTKIARVYACCY